MAYLERYDRPGSESGWHFLTGEEASIEALTWAIGFRYTYNPRTQLYAHAAGVVVVTPDGGLPATFTGSIFRPRNSRPSSSARARAASVAPIGRLLLLCYDYDAATGKYTLSILQADPRFGNRDGGRTGGFRVRDVPPRAESAPRDGPSG